MGRHGTAGIAVREDGARNAISGPRGAIGNPPCDQPRSISYTLEHEWHLAPFYSANGAFAGRDVCHGRADTADRFSLAAWDIDATFEGGASTRARNMPVMLGQSPAFCSARALLRRYAASDAQILIGGETGTGKELAAREIHYASSRRGEPFVPVNCGAIQDGLIESELFGHAKGAFTDAKQAQVGLVEHAGGGTLLLDEVNSLSGKAQVTLLRFLQDSEYRPVGGTLRTSRARAIAATNIDLAQLVVDGNFRGDLLYRLNALYIHLPPLREREGDVVLLAEHFLAAMAERTKGPPRRWSTDALQALSTHEWPGNVRELENVVLRGYTLADGETIGLEELLAAEPAIDESWRLSRGSQPQDSMGFRHAKALAIEAFERDYLTRVLRQALGSVTRAAELAGKERRALGKLLKKYGIR